MFYKCTSWNAFKFIFGILIKFCVHRCKRQREMENERDKMNVIANIFCPTCFHHPVFQQSPAFYQLGIDHYYGQFLLTIRIWGHHNGGQFYPLLWEGQVYIHGYITYPGFKHGLHRIRRLRYQQYCKTFAMQTCVRRK